MKKFIFLFSLAAALIFIASPEVQAQWKLYDDFTGLTIDRNKWIGTETATDNMEVIRMIESGELHLFNRAYGSIGSASQKVGALRLNFINPDAIKGIRANIRINDYEAEGCTDSTVATWTRLRLRGNFFNVTKRIEGDSTNDVIAYIGVLRQSDFIDPPNTLRVVTSIWRCLNKACSSNADIEVIHYRQIGTLEIDTWTKLGIEWNPDKNSFVFLLDNNKETVDYSLYLQSHNFNDIELPGVKSKCIETYVNCPDCSASPRSMGSMDVHIDEVYAK